MPDPATTTSPATGIFCWHELYTPDAEASKKFYGELLGWTTEAHPMKTDTGEFTYHLLKRGETSFGGMMEMTGPQWEGVPPHWMGYLSVDDLDRKVNQVESLGGKLCMQPTDIPEVGRFAVVTDPTGAPFILFAGNEPAPALDVIVWNELLTNDPPPAKTFYTDLIGWSTEEMDMGPMGVYTVFKEGDVYAGGMMKMPPDAQAPPNWLFYIAVDDVDEITSKSKQIGATVFVEPRDIPNIGRFSVIADPQGATIALYKSANK